jgi:hypothetical protein
MPVFTEETASQGSMDLIPAGTLAWATVMVKEFARSKSAGGEQASIEVVLASGPFQRRKVWGFVANPDDAAHSEGYRTMGQGQLVRMLEALGVCVPGQPNTYQRPELATFQGCFDIIQRGIQAGRYIGVKVGIEKAQAGSGYGDKNKIESFLTPNPKSGSANDWSRLQAGDKPGESSTPAHAQRLSAAPAPGSFGGFGAPAAPRPNAMAQPAWVGGPAGSPPAPVGGAGANINDEIPF